MSAKKIVKLPTPESSPFLYYGDDNKIIENFVPRICSDINKSFSPVSFDDISTFINLKEKYHSMTPKMSWSGKFCDFFNYSKYGLTRYAEKDFLGVFLFIPIVTIDIVATFFAIILLDSFIDNDPLFIVVSIIIIITMSFFTYNSCCFTYDKITDFNSLPKNMKYHIKFYKKDKKLLKDKVFLDTSSYKEQENHKKTINSIIKAVNLINNTAHSNSIGTYELKTLYNEYMQLLSFTLTNKDNISQELYDDYDQQLKELSQEIVKESDNIVTIIKEKGKYVEKNKEKLDNINQEILDNDAITIFPRKYNNL